MRLFIFSALMGLSLAAFAKGNYTITATLPNADLNGEKAFLVNYDTQDTISNATIKGNKVTIKGETENPFMARLYVDGKRKMFIVEPGYILLNVEKSKAVGSPLNVKFNKLTANLDTIKVEDNYYNTLVTTFKANQDNPIGLWCAIQYAADKELNKEQLDSFLEGAPESLKNSTRIKGLYNCARQKELTAEGKLYTDFTATTEDGKLQKFSDYVTEGKFTLVDFWASWCGPCRREIPNIKALYDKYKDQGLNVVGVAVWDKQANSEQAMKQLGINWPVMLNGQKDITDTYGIIGIPHIMILGPDGTIISRGLHGDKLKAKVDELMLPKH